MDTRLAGGDARISSLTPITTLNATDIFPIVQGSQTKSVTALQLALLILAVGPITISGGTLNNVTIGNLVPGPATFTSMSAASIAGAAFGAGIPTFLATPNSANLAAAVTDETGSGALVFATSPVLVTPNIGTPSAGSLGNTTGYPIARDIHAATAKTPLVSADEFGIWDSVTGTLQKSTWGSMLSQMPMGLPYVHATGTSDAITATYTIPGFVSLTDGFDLTLGIGTANTTNAPTFTPTINTVAQTTHTIVKFVNNIAVAVAAGDVQGDVWLKYDLPNTRWILQNPSLASIGNILYADATGTSDAITATYQVANPTVGDGYDLTVGIVTPNTTSTPTFAPTLNGIVQTALTIVKFIGNVEVAVAPGDLQGDVWLKFDLPNLKWVLMNPASLNVQQLQSIAASVATNALTVSLNPTILTFRNATLTTGTVTQLSIPTALSLTVPNTATLGTINNVQAQLALLVAYNAGSPVLCIVNTAGGVNLDESTLISPTTISTGATANNVIYSASAVGANSPFRFVGYIFITEATAGTWATGHTLAQGYGGEAGAALQSLGMGQTWQNMAGSRVSGTTYYNSTGRPIEINVAASGAGANSVAITVNGVSVSTYSVPSGSNATSSAIVPPGGSYVATLTTAIAIWAELR